MPFFYKMKNWVDMFMRIPFNRYENIPMSIDQGIDKCSEYMMESKQILDDAVYGMEDAKMQIEIIDKQIDQRQKTIDRSQYQLDKMDELIITQSKESSWFSSSSQRAITERNNQKEERLLLEKTIEESLNKINELTDKKSGIQTEQLKLEADLGPIKYVAEFIYGDEAKDHFDKAVRIIIIILIFVFDPVEVLMLISANISLKQRELENEAPTNANDEVAKILNKQKKVWKKEREYQNFVNSLSDDELKGLSPDEIRLKMNQIWEWNEDTDEKYKNNV